MSSWVADLQDASEWPERRALLDSESKAKVLRRYQSNDSCSMMLSSPLAPEECEWTGWVSLLLLFVFFVCFCFIWESSVYGIF